MSTSILVRFSAAVAALWSGVAGAQSLALRDFRELPAALEVATGVPARDPDIALVYRRVNTRLPMTGAVDELSSPMLLAATELGALFCSKAIQREAAQQASVRKLFRNADFARGPVQFTPASVAVLAESLAQAFWQRSATAEETRDILATVQAARSAGGAAAADTPKVLQVTCTTFATSLAFLVI